MPMLGIIIQVCNPSTWEVEARGEGAHRWPLPCAELEASLHHMKNSPKKFEAGEVAQNPHAGSKELTWKFPLTPTCVMVLKHTRILTNK